MRPIVMQRRGECGLRIVPFLGRQAGRLPGRRAPAVAGDQHASGDRHIVRSACRDSAAAEGELLQAAGQEGQSRGHRSGIAQGRDETMVFDVGAELDASDLGRSELDGRTAEQGRRVVDDAHHLQWLGIDGQLRPQAKACQEADGAFEQRNRPSGRPQVDVADEDDGDASLGEGHAERKSDRPAPTTTTSAVTCPGLPIVFSVAGSRVAVGLVVIAAPVDPSRHGVAAGRTPCHVYRADLDGGNQRDDAGSCLGIGKRRATVP